MTDRRTQDKAWEAIQQKTFTGWVNSHLRKRGLKVEDLLTDLSDGLNLIQLLEIISGDDFGFRYEKRPRIRIMKVGNVNYCLQFIKDRGVKLAGTGAEEIVDGNTKMTLGLIWTLILRFAIADISLEEMSAKEALLLWCQRKTEPYDNVSVKNFTFSFQDGLAFCALIHRHRPDLLDYDSLSKEDKLGNLNLAFEVAEKHLDIPKLLDAEDIVNMPKPDERSIVTYVAMYYHVFASSQKAETAGRRVAKVIGFAEEVAKIQSDYIERATKLSAWIGAKEAELGDRTFDNTLDGVTQLIADFRDYKQTEKEPQSNERVELEAVFNSLQAKLKINKRAAFVPPAGLAPTELASQWSALERAEHERFLALRNELRRQKKIAMLVSRFNASSSKSEAWANNKKDRLATAELGDSISAVLANQKNHDAFEQEYTARRAALGKLAGWASELEGENYNDIASVRARLDALNGVYDELKVAGDTRRDALQARLDDLQSVQNLQLDFAKRALSLATWLDAAEENLTSPINVDTVEGIREIKSDFEQFQSDHAGQEGEFQAVGRVAGQCEQAGVSEAEFSEVSWAQLQDLWNNVTGLIGERGAAIDAEAQTQEANEKLRLAFADAAKSFVAWVESQSVSDEIGEDLDAALAAAQARNAEIAAESDRLDEVKAVNARVEEAGVLDNPHTEITWDICKREWDRLVSLGRQQEQAVQQALVQGKGTTLSSEQVKEMKECFDHFDKDKDGLLARLDFGACLRTLGEEVSLEEEGGRLDEILKSIDGDGDGSVNFDEFVGHMEKVAADSDTPDQIKEAFACIAGDKDFVTEADLRAVLPQEKADYCLANMKPYEGVENGYDYRTFTDNLYN